MIAVCRLRYCPRTQAYAQRRTADGKTKTEIIRCLKRYIARELYHALVADLLPGPPDALARSSPSPAAPARSARPSRPLDIYRNVPGRLRVPTLTPGPDRTAAQDDGPYGLALQGKLLPALGPPDAEDEERVGVVLLVTDVERGVPRRRAQLPEPALAHLGSKARR
jgi:hypothetical protein